MSLVHHPSVVVVVYDGQVQFGVARCALKHRWEILDGRTERSLTKRILVTHPKAMLLQVPASVEPATSLIARLRLLCTPPAILAVAAEHSEQAEAQVRAAGVSAYLDQSADADSIERTIRSIAPGAIPAPAQVEAKSDQARGRATRTRIRRTPRLAAPDGLAPVRHERRAE